MLAIVFFFLFSLTIAVNIGRGLEKNSLRQNKEEIRTASDYFSEQQVNEFLTAFFTFKNNGENYPRYEIFLSQQAKKREEERSDQRNFLPQFFGNSVFLASENYIRIVNEHQIEVICQVRRKIDSLNQEGKIVAKNIEKEVMLKLYYRFEETTSQFLIESYKVLERH